jgi:hypothetical protein
MELARIFCGKNTGIRKKMMSLLIPSEEIFLPENILALPNPKERILTCL